MKQENLTKPSNKQVNCAFYNVTYNQSHLQPGNDHEELETFKQNSHLQPEKDHEELETFKQNSHCNQERTMRN
jgi:hypothetical protein